MTKFNILKHGRYWAVWEGEPKYDVNSGELLRGKLVAVVLYKKGAEEIVKRLSLTK